MIKLGFRESMRALTYELVVINEVMNPQPDGVCYSQSAQDPPIRGNFGFRFKRGEGESSAFIRCPYGNVGDEVEVRLNFFARLVLASILPKFLVRTVEIKNPDGRYWWRVVIERKKSCPQ
jgi:hypothetical protein